MACNPAICAVWTPPSGAVSAGWVTAEMTLLGGLLGTGWWVGFGLVPCLQHQIAAALRVQPALPVHHRHPAHAVHRLACLPARCSPTKVSPSITIKEECVLLNIGGVRAVVTDSKCLLFEPASPSSRKFLEIVMPKIQSAGGHCTALRKQAWRGGKVL